ncbi:MAG TPA: VWA domain-containing protein [Burkholderiales bacterium]|nr:VWA domain-containing protein [Burkholderiales bacterium]
MKFLWPEALWLLWLLPFAAAGYAAVVLRRRAAAKALAFPGLAAGTRGWRAHLAPLLYLLALAVLILASARPTALVTLPSHQRTLILAIDVSLSMRAADVQPSRLGAAQAAARDFIREQPADVRIGIVSFAGTAELIQPPTRDKDELTAAIDRLQLDRHTAIGSGIIMALATLFPDDGIDLEAIDLGPRAASAHAGKKAPPRQLKRVPPGSNTHAAIILLTDGRRTMGPDPLDAARMAAERGVRVFTVGFGSANGGPVSIEGYSIFMQYDEETLKAIAQLTAAEYFHAASSEELRRIYDSLTSRFVMEQGETELTAFFALAAALLVLAAAAFSLMRANRIL